MFVEIEAQYTGPFLAEDVETISFQLWRPLPGDGNDVHLTRLEGCDPGALFRDDAPKEGLEPGSTVAPVVVHSFHFHEIALPLVHPFVGAAANRILGEFVIANGLCVVLGLNQPLDTLNVRNKPVQEP